MALCWRHIWETSYYKGEVGTTQGREWCSCLGGMELDKARFAPVILIFFMQVNLVKMNTASMVGCWHLIIFPKLLPHPCLISINSRQYLHGKKLKPSYVNSHSLFVLTPSILIFHLDFLQTKVTLPYVLLICPLTPSTFIHYYIHWNWLAIVTTELIAAKNQWLFFRSFT